MKKGDYLDLDIEGYAFEGKGISRVKKDDEAEKNFVIFANGSYPGDKVKAKITKVKKYYNKIIHIFSTYK